MLEPIHECRAIYIPYAQLAELFSYH